MPDHTGLDIPYERQTDPVSNRMCGSAALCMVYRSFGMSCSQAELAAKLTTPTSPGQSGARSYLLAKDALTRGLSAMVLRAREPLRILKACRDQRLRVILNHRPRLDSLHGHFTVLVDLAADDIVVHDPLIGPNTRIRVDDLFNLWQPLGPQSEITGNVLIVLAKGRQQTALCRRCGSTIPDAITCPGCGQSVPLSPASVLGCTLSSCPERAWETLFCPGCDCVLTATPGNEFKSTVASRPGDLAGVPGLEKDRDQPPGTGSVASDDDPLKIQYLNQEIDKFLALLLSVNGGQPVPGSQKYFTMIRQIQSQLPELQRKQIAERRARAARPLPPAMPSKPEPPVAATPPPRPPVDWNELARKLVEEIGYRPR